MNPVGYEYAIQFRNDSEDEWLFYSTNKFDYDRPYPNQKSVNNALSQIKTVRKWGQRGPTNREYRIVSRPYGEWGTPSV